MLKKYWDWKCVCKDRSEQLLHICYGNVSTR